MATWSKLHLKSYMMVALNVCNSYNKGSCELVYLKAVRLLLAVPDGAGQRELLADAVFLHGTQRTPPESFRLPVVRVQPQILQLGVRLARKPVALEDLIQSLKVPHVEGNQRSCAHYGFVPVERLPGRTGDGGGQRPQKPPKAFDIPGLLQILAHPSDLVRSEHRQRKHVASSFRFRNVPLMRKISFLCVKLLSPPALFSVPASLLTPAASISHLSYVTESFLVLGKILQGSPR